MPEISVLVPEATRNLIKNPSFEKGVSGWSPGWTRVVSLEDGELEGLPFGFDTISGADFADISIASGDALVGEYSMLQPVTAGAWEGYGQLSNLGEQSNVTVEFVVDFSDFTMEDADAEIAALLSLVANTFNVLQIQTRSSTAGVPQIRLLMLDDALASTTSPWIQMDISRPILVRSEFMRSSAAGADDGYGRLWVNNVLIVEIIGMDNDAITLDSVLLGRQQDASDDGVGNIVFDHLRYAATGIPQFIGADVASVNSEARFGIRSGLITTDGDVIGEGVYYRVSPNTSNTSYVGSIYLRGSGLVRLRLKDGFNGTQRVGSPFALDKDRWTRHDIVGLTGPVLSNDLRLYVETAEKIQQIAFYVDGAQIEKKDHLTSYCDGDQEGCRWNIQEHNSESSRDGDVAFGGHWEVLAPFCRNKEEALDLDLYITETSGFGMPPIRLNIQEFAVEDGAFLQRQKVLSRPVIMTFWAINRDGEKQKDNSLARLQQLRQLLVNLVKPRRIKGAQPVWLRYQGEGSNVIGYLALHYEAGLELDIDIRNRYYNSFAMRLLAVDPLWIEDNQEVF